MDSRPVQTHAHESDQHHNQPHNLGLQQEEHQHDHEKKSVLKKVKAKAKKIKDTITKHGHHDNEHGHHYEDQHIPDDHDLDEEDDDDEEEMVEDPEIHGAPIYDSAAVKSGTHAQNLGVKFGGTSIMGVEPPHHQPKVVVVSPTTETDQSRVIDPARTFAGVGEGIGAHHHNKVNLERPMGLEEDPHAPGSRLHTHTHAPANYETKVTDPTGAGGAEIDITPVQNSFARMNVHNNEPKPDLSPKILPPVAETQYLPSVGGFHQFEPELSTATKTQFPQAETYDQHLPQLSSEIKTNYPRSHDMSGLSTATRTTQYPSAITHDLNSRQISSPTNTQYPPAISHNQNLPQMSSATNTQYPSLTSHDKNLPQMSSATNTQYPSAISHNQNLPQMSSVTNTQYPSAISHDQNLSHMSSATRTAPYPSAGSHDQFMPEFSTDPGSLYPPAKNFDQNFLEQSKTQYPSVGSHDQFSPEPTIPTSTNRYEENSLPIGQTFNTNTTTVGAQPQPHYESMENPSNQSSYTDKISSATSAIADKAVAAKNMVASKLGYGEQEGEKNQNEETRGGEKPSNQSSYISSATSAIADKAASAKNTVASKLGYGEKEDETEKNVASTKETHENASSTTMSSSPTEYGKKIAQSLTEKLAPVYGKVAGVGSTVKSKAPGTETDKGVSVKDYFAEKLRPGDEDRALSEVISETLYKRNNEEEKTSVVHGEADRDMKNVVSDAMHKRGEEEHVNRPLMGKVTESEEVKRRLGSDEVTERKYEERYVNSPGQGVVDKLKGVVGSWFSKQEDENLSSSQGQGAEQVNQGAGERRLQESSN